MTRRALIVYGTSYGQTAHIAHRIEDTLVARGFDVETIRADLLAPDTRVQDYDGVLVGASMVSGRYQKYVNAFVRRHAAALNTLPSAFFAVSGSAGSKNPAERAESSRRAEAFCARAQWRPAITESIAGAIKYTRYNFVLRWFMKRISRKEGGSTDTSRDHEYTDWSQVARFAARFADLIAAPAVVSATLPAR